MLTLIKSDGSGMILNADDYCVKELANGLDELQFEISVYDPAYPLLMEEAEIVEESPETTATRYLVKAIDAGNETATIKCQINLDDWKVDLYRSLTVYSSVSPEGTSARYALIGPTTGQPWTVIDDAPNVKAFYSTIELEGVTPLDEAQYLLTDVFVGLGYRFDNIRRTIRLCDVNAVSSKMPYITRDVNLREINYKGKSTAFATRLYPYGKDGLSIASVNDGKFFIDDNSYSSKVVSAYWQDDSYDNAANLLRDARQRLAEMARPVRSYEVDVVDLAAIDPTYSHLSFPLFQPAVLIDEVRGLRATLRVVERWIYPNLPQNNKIIFSSSAQRIQSQVARNSARKILKDGRSV